MKNFLLLFVCIICISACKGKSYEPVNIVLLTIDTLRADHVGCYGHKKNTTPNIDKLAKDGILYKYSISQAPWTLPSISSIFTSLYPSQHNAITHKSRLNKKSFTITEKLHSLNYHTIGIISSFFTNKEKGLDQGFDIYDDSQESGHYAISSKELSLLGIKYIENRMENKPFFLWIHYFDPHVTYIRHPEFHFADNYKGEIPKKISGKYLDQIIMNKEKYSEKDIDYIKNVYDEEIAFTDIHIGLLVDYLEDNELYENTVIIVTSDHGEYFLERGKFLHGKDVYYELINVPLIISGGIDKKFRGKKVNRPVETISIPKTILSIIKADSNEFQGENLLDIHNKGIPVFSEGNYAYGTNHRKECVIWKNWKLIHILDNDTYELYNIKKDKKEINNLINQSTNNVFTKYNVLKKKLDSFPNDYKLESIENEIDQETLEKLKSLGYVN